MTVLRVVRHHPDGGGTGHADSEVTACSTPRLGSDHGRHRRSDEPGTPAKLRTPAAPAHYVRRPRLLEFVDEVTRAPLTVVVAPRGKTSLLTGWVAERTEPCAWLSLDPGDRDAVRFWVGVISALETFRPGCGSRACKHLLDAGPSSTRLRNSSTISNRTAPKPVRMPNVPSSSTISIASTRAWRQWRR